MITAELVEFHRLRALFLAEHDLAFVVGNPASKGESVIYITNDPELGKLDLTIANNSASPIGIGPASLLKIFVSPPLTDADVKRIKLATTDWRLTPGDDCLELRRSSQISIPSKGTLTIPFADVMASGEATTGYFTFDYTGFTGTEDESRRVTVFVQRPPKGDPPPIAFDTGARPEYAGQQSRTVYVTPWAITTTQAGIANHIVLQVGNNRADAPIKSSPTSDAKIVVSFTSGKSDLSICSDEQIKVVAGKTVQGEQWRVEREISGPVPVWAMRPPQGAVNIFAAGEMIAVRFDPIVSRLPPNFASPMFVQFVNIPGYNDVYGAFFLQKVPPVPYVGSFDAYSGTKKLAPGAVVGFKEKITLAWDAFAAERVRILELKQAFPPTQKSVDVFPAESTHTYTLVPEIGSDSRHELRKNVNLAVSVPVAKLAASPDAVGPAEDSTLQWNCSNGSHCVLTGGGINKENLPLVDSFLARLNDTTVFTVTCVGAGSSSASVTVRVPPPELKFSVSVRFREIVIQWTTRWANRVEVRFRYILVDSRREGTLPLVWELSSGGVPVEIRAWGNGFTHKEVTVTREKPYIEFP
jgi:hypothetical protein